MLLRFKPGFHITQLSDQNASSWGYRGSEILPRCIFLCKKAQYFGSLSTHQPPQIRHLFGQRFVATKESLANDVPFQSEAGVFFFPGKFDGKPAKLHLYENP